MKISIVYLDNYVMFTIPKLQKELKPDAITKALV